MPLFPVSVRRVLTWLVSMATGVTHTHSHSLTARFRALRVDQFEGIEILVSFTSKTAHTDLVSLSGGQKALVSLAFIFALQQVDPTPFYVFDEVDQNLDDSYRTCVAGKLAVRWH